MKPKAFLIVLLGTLYFPASALACVEPSNATMQASLSKDLAKFHVSVLVDDCVAVLDGKVERLSDKLAAAKKAYRYEALSSVINHIRVVAPAVEDSKLAAAIQRKLCIDREWNGTLESFGVTAYEGQVVLSGVAYGPMAHDEAIALVASTKGVTDIVDAIQVLPANSLYRVLTDTRSRIYGLDYMDLPKVSCARH